MQQREAEGALAALIEYLNEAKAGRAERLFREAGEFADPFDFADAAINNLPAIAYALNAGLPVIEWAPAAKNTAETERVLRAMRQWDEQSRLLLQQLAAGEIDQDQFYNGLVEAYVRQSTNAYVAGRRAVGNLAPIPPEEYDVLEDALDDDVFRLGQLRTDLEGGLTIGGLIASMVLDPTNYFGSGLPGDPFAPKKEQAASHIRGGSGAGRQLRDYQNRMDQYASSIRSRQHMGEMAGLDAYVPRDAQLVWWTLGPADHCIDCVRLSDMSPYYAGSLNGIFPGSGHTKCGSRCQCFFEYDIPSTVCADPFQGAGLADFGIHGEYGDQQFIEAIRTPLSEVRLLESAAEPGKINVFIQEAASCSRPMDIASLNARSEYSAIDDADAFNWDHDVAALMRGSLDESVTWDDVLRRLSKVAARRQAAARLTDAELATLRRMFEPLANAMPGGLDGVKIATYEADGAKFAAAWRETGEAVRLEVGMVTDGLPVLETEFNLRLLNDLSERAASKGLRFEVNGEMLNDGARRWLDALGADHLALPGAPPTITPAFPLRGIAPAPPRVFEYQDEAVAWGQRMWPVPEDAELYDLVRAPQRLGMSQTEMDAINAYTNGHYGYMNARLRGADDWLEQATDMAGWETAEEVDSWISAIAAVQARNPVPEDVVVWRGISKTGLNGLSPQDAVGKTFTEKGFMSTSLGPMPDLNRTFSGVDYDMHLRLQVPEGTPAYYTRNVSAFKDEQELLLAPGLDFQVVAVEQRGKEWIIDARIVPKAPEAAPLRGIAPEPPFRPLPDVPPDVYADIERFEDAIVGEPFEQGLLISPDGTIVEEVSSGGRLGDQAAAFTEDVRGNILSHSHPSNASFRDLSFSLEDVQVASKGVVEMRAVTENWRYVMQPGPDGWPSVRKINKVFKEHEDAFNEALEAVRKRVWADASIPVADKAAAVVAAQADRMHRIWTSAADELGVIYQRVPRVPGAAPLRGIAPSADPMQSVLDLSAPLRKLADHEEGLIIDARTGDLLTHITPSAKVTTMKVPVTWEDVATAKGNIFVHNHPGADSGYVTAFSRPDLAAAAQQDVAMTVVVTDRFTYTLAPGPGGWPSSEQMSRVLTKIEKREKARRLEEIRRINALGPKAPDRQALLAATNAINSPHSNMALMADELGLVYRRTEVAPLRGIPAKDPVAALPQWPEMSLLKDEVPEAVAAIGGAETKRIFIDPAGNRWLAKTSPEAVRAEVAAAKLGHELGLRMPPVRVVKVDGVTMSLQPMVPGEDLAKRIGAALPPAGQAPSAGITLDAAKALTDEQASELAGQAVLDFVIANADTHAANWVIDDAGRLWGIDKGFAFRGASATSANPASFYLGTHGGLFGRAVESASQTGFLLKTKPDDIGRILDRLDAMSDTAFFDAMQVSDDLPSALQLVSQPFGGTFAARVKAMKKRKDAAREGFAELFDTAIGNAGKNVSPEWRAWREAGATFVRNTDVVPAPNAVVAAAPTAMPSTVAMEQVPAMWRSTLSQASTAGNNRATWQAGFAPSATKEAAEARIRSLLPNLEDATLDGFDLPQMNLMVARLEHLQERGVDLGLLRGLSDYTTVPVSEHDFSIGLTVGKRISLKHDNAWKFNPLEASHPTAYDDMGGLLAHEYGHVIFHDLSPAAQTQMIDLYKAQKATAADDISTYATESLDEWFGETFAKITAPGYQPGTLRYDSEVWSVLAADGKVRKLDLPVAKAVADPVPPLPDVIAKGPYKASTEMVPTATLRRYADVDIKSLDPTAVAKVREDIAAHGIRQPVVLQYSRTEERLALTDGALRLAVANDMGIKYVPARVQRSSGAFPANVGMRSKKVPTPVFPDEHVPLNFRPSQVIPPDEWVAKRVLGDDLATAPPIPPITSPQPAPFVSPPSDMLAVKPLPPGKKMGGMSSKQIYVDPTGTEWLVKPKKVFVDDVELSRAAIDLEAAVSPLANRFGLNVSPVVSTTIDYPWVPGAPLKTVGASIQPITPGINHMPVVPVPEGQAIPSPNTFTSPGSSTKPIPGNVAWDELSDENLNDLAQNQMFDWFLGNDDGHIGQFLLDSNGKILGIDKDAAFWELPSQYAQGDAIPEYGKHIVHTWWADMTPERLGRIKPKSVESLLDKIDAIPDAEYRAYIEPHLDVLLAHPNGVKLTREQWAQAIVDRKRNMRADFTAYYQRQLSDLAEAGMKLPPEWDRVLKDGFREAVPHRRPLPNPATKQNLRDAEARWLDARNTVQDVLDGKVDVSIGWNVGEFNAANAAGLKYRKIGGFRFHATSEEPLDRIAAYLAEPGHSSMDDGFWAAMGYSPEQIAIRNDLQRLMRPVQNPTEGLPLGGKGGFVERPVGQPLGPPKKAPEKPWFKPADHQMYTLPGSPIPLNGPRVEWSGKVPKEPPPPVAKATPEQIADAEAAAEKAYGEVADVIDGKRDAVWSWSAGDAKIATDHGLLYENYKGARIIARSDDKMAELKAFLDGDGRVSDDEFWHLLGYSDRDLDAIDRAADIRRTKRVGAGVMIVEPDGRMWVLAPRNEWAGYQNTVIKGGADPNESLAEAAVREVREESGFSVELDAYLGDYGNTDGTAITRMYVGHRTGGGPLWAKQKETHEIRLLTPDEAKQMLTRYKKPDARDQAILADTLEALNGSPGLIDYSIPATDAAEFAAKTGPVEGPAALGARPRSTPASPSPKYAINPDPVADLPVATVFNYDEATVTHAMANYAESPPSSTKFPYATTRYKAPNGEVSAMYWKEEAQAGKKRVFWANSKKQVSDPKLRYDYAVAHVARLGEHLAVDITLDSVRVNETLLAGLPQLREMLIAAGGVPAGTGKYVDIDRTAFMALGDAIRNKTPLPALSGHVPTAPMKPVPKSVGTGGYDVKAVGELLGGVDVTPGNTMGGSAMLTLHWNMPSGVMVQTEVGPMLGDAVSMLGPMYGHSPAETQALVMANLGVAAGYAADHPEITRIIAQVGWDDEPGVAALLDAIGMKQGSLGFREISVADFNAVKENLIVSLASEGYNPSLVSTGITPALVTPKAPTSNLADAYKFEPDMVTGATTTPVLKETANVGQVTWYAPHNSSAAASWVKFPARIRWNAMEAIASTAPERSGLWVRQLVDFGDRLELNPSLKELIIEPAVYAKAPAGITDLLDDFAAVTVASSGEVKISRANLLELRDAVMGPLTKQLPYLPPGPVGTALDFDAALLESPSLVAGIGDAFGMNFAKTKVTVQSMPDGLYLHAPTPSDIASVEDERMNALAAMLVMRDRYLVSGTYDRAYFSTALDSDVRALLLHRGAQEKAGMLVMDRQAFLDVADEIGLAKPAAAAAPLPATNDAAGTAKALLEGTDSKITFAGPKGGEKPMTHTSYGDEGNVTWWRIGNDLEVADINVTDAAFNAYMVKAAKVMEENPKIEVLRFRDSSQLEDAQYDFLDPFGWTKYNVGGRKLTREQVFDVRNTILNDTSTAAAKVAPEPAAPALGPAYGFDGAIAGVLKGDIAKQTGQYSKVVWTQPNVTGQVTTRYAELKTELVWDRIFGDEALLPHAAARQIKFLGALLDESPDVKRIRFERTHQIPKGIRDMLDAHGATWGDNVAYLPRENALELRAALASELSHGPIEQAAAAVPVPTAVSADATLWEVAQADFNTAPLGLTPPILDSMADGTKIRRWTVGDGVDIDTVEKLVANAEGKWRLQFEGISVGVGATSLDAMGVTVANLHRLAKQAAVSTDTTFAVRVQALSYGGSGGPGFALRDALLNAGAVKEGEYLVFTDELTTSLLSAIQNNTKIAPLVGAAPPKITIVSTPGTTLSAQYGFFPDPMKSWKDSTKGVLEGERGHVAIGSLSTDWFIGEYFPTEGDAIMGIAINPSAQKATQNEPQQLHHDLALLRHLDAIAMKQPQNVDAFLWSPGDLAPTVDKMLKDAGAKPFTLGSDMYMVDGSLLHQVALAIDGNLPLDMVPIGSAAEAVPLTGAKPDILPTLGFADSDTGTAALIDQHAQPLHSMNEPGTNSVEYFGTGMSSEFETTAKEVIWFELADTNHVPNPFVEKQALLAETRRLAKHIVDNDMESLLVTQGLANKYPELKALLVGYGGKAQNSGALVIKKDELAELLEAIDDQLGLAPLSTAATGAMSSIGRYSFDNYNAVAKTYWQGLSMDPGIPQPLAVGPNHHTKVYKHKNETEDYGSVYGWVVEDGVSVVEWRAFAAPYTASNGDKRAVAAWALTQLSELAGEGVSPLVIRKALLDANPFINDIATALGAKVNPNTGDLFFEGWDTAAAANTLAQNGVPMPVVTGADFEDLAAMPAPATDVLGQIDEVLNDFFSGSWEGTSNLGVAVQNTNKIVKPLGHPGVQSLDYPPTPDAWYLQQGKDKIIEQWHQGFLTTSKADSLLDALGVHPPYVQSVSGYDIPAYLSAATDDVAAGLMPGAGSAMPGTEAPITIEGGQTLSQYVTGKTMAQLETEWQIKTGYQSNGYWMALDPSLPYNATVGAPQKNVTIGVLDYKQRRVITSPYHNTGTTPAGLDAPGKKWGWKGSWSGGSDEQKAEALWMEFKRSASQAANPVEYGYKIGEGYGYHATGVPKAVFVHGDATRMQPKIKEIMDQFGAKKKTLGTGKVGLGYEVPANKVGDLNAFLNAEAPYTAGKFTPGVPPPAPPPSAAIPTPTSAPTMPTPNPVAAAPPPPATMANVYGFDAQMLKNLSDDVSAAVPSLTPTTLSKPGAKTHVFNDHWANGVDVKYANEIMSAKTGSRVMRIRSVENFLASNSGGANALLATVAQMPDRMAQHPTMIALIIDKKAIAEMPGIQTMLKDAGWKETATSWTLQKDKVSAFATDVLDGKASWMPSTAIPQSVAAAPNPTVGVGQSIPEPTVIAPPTPAAPPAPVGPPPAPREAAALTVAGVPKKPTPSFIYGYDETHQKQIGQTLVNRERADALDASGQPLQAGAVGYELEWKSPSGSLVMGHWSVSPSGKAVGWTDLMIGVSVTQEEARDAAFAMLRHIAAEGTVREKFFIQPKVYDQVPGLRQILLDSGAQEQNFPKLGTAIQVDAAQAQKLVAALDTDTMSGLKVQISTTSDYLGFEGAGLETLGTTPKYNDAYHHEWKVGEQKPVVETITDLDAREATWQDIKGGSAADKATAAMAELQWVSDQGIENLTILPQVVHDIPKFDKWLLSMGAKVEDGNLVLDAVAINNARKHIVKNALPELLGGSKMPYSIVDEMNSSTIGVIDALHGELVTVAGTGKKSTFSVANQSIESTWSRSDSNIYWSNIKRQQGASIGHMRTAAVAQWRSFLNEVASNGGLRSIDVNMEVLTEVPALRAVLLKYGAREVPPKGSADAYLSLDRSKALKMRNDIEAELSQASAGIGSTFIAQHNAVVKWPTVEDLKPATSPGAVKAMKQGQTRKAVFIDADGNEWLFKPGLSGRGAVTDRAVAELAEMLGLPVPPVRIYTLEYEGQMVSGSLQKMVPGKGMKEAGISSPKDLSPAQTESLFRHSVLDWLVANDDAHIGNWIIGDEGQFWAIDKARSWVSFHTSQDVLDTMSEGNMGGTPWLFQFFREARANPALLQKVSPQTIAQPLRILRGLPDEDFLRIVDPVATAKAADRKAGGAYLGKKDRLLDDMLKRKHEIAADFERYLSNEIKTILKANPDQVPPVWKSWLDNGGTINLDATPKDLWQEELAALNAEFGASGAAAVQKAKQLMNEQHLKAITQKINQYFGSGYHGTGHVKGYGAELIREAVRRASKEGESRLREWEKLNRWAILNIVNDPSSGTGSYFETIRQYWDAEKGTFRVVRSTNRYGSNPKAYIPGYQKDGGLRDLVGTAIGRHVVVGASGGVYLYIEVPYDQVFSNFALGFGYGGGGEQELLIRDVRLDQIIHIRAQHDELSLSQLMTYQGPVDTK